MRRSRGKMQFNEAKTCPKCGALIVAQLARCRQCKTYLHGTALEGLLVDVLPERYQHAPGTFVAVLLILAYYLLMVMLAGSDSLLGFSPFTLRQMGALNGPDLLDNQHWRYLTYMFGHHDIVHLSFNVVALISSGQIVERLYDRKKMFLMYVAAGVGGGLASLVYYVYIRHQPLFVSAGASGAVSGMIGAALLGARKQGYEGRDVAKQMLQWTVYMVAWGFMMKGINNAAHLGGFLAGAGLARLLPLGSAHTPGTQKALSVMVFSILALVVASMVMMMNHKKGFPTALAKDEHPRSLLGLIQYHEGYSGDESDQKRIWDECVNREFIEPAVSDPLHACELNMRTNSYDPRSYTELAGLLEEQGDHARATRMLDIATMLSRR